MKIKKLSLTNFRRFKTYTLDFEKDWTIIVGPNARGKSTIIEAIHLLSTGQSPWTNDNTTMFRTFLSEEEKGKTANAYTELVNGTIRMQAEIESEDDINQISISIQKNNNSITKRYEIDGSATTRNKFSECIHTILFSPQMIDFLMFEPKLRREFLDEQIMRVEPFYSDLTNKYSKVLRQRNSLLKLIRKQRFQNNGNGYSNGYNLNNNSSETKPANQGNKTPIDTLKFWSEQLIEIGSSIIKYRMDFIEKMNSVLVDRYKSQLIYAPKVQISSLTSLAKTSESYIRDTFRNQLISYSEKEQLIGTTVLGPHRDDWHLQSDSERNLNIYGSRGEKRMAIADIIFKVNSYMSEEIGQMPIILLDDISSELDSDNISLLFNEKINKNQQTIITTVNENFIPKKARDMAQVIYL